VSLDIDIQNAGIRRQSDRMAAGRRIAASLRRCVEGRAEAIAAETNRDDRELGCLGRKAGLSTPRQEPLQLRDQLGCDVARKSGAVVPDSALTWRC